MFYVISQLCIDFTSMKDKKKKKNTEFGTKIMEPALVHKYSVPVIEPVESS